MKRVLLIIILSVTGCAKTGTITPLTDSAKQTLMALEQSIPAQCQTEIVKANLDAIKTQIEAIPAVCTTEIKPYKAELDKWRIFTYGLLLLIGIFGFNKLKNTL